MLNQQRPRTPTASNDRSIPGRPMARLEGQAARVAAEAAPSACNVMSRICGGTGKFQWLGQDSTYNPADKGRPPTASSTGYVAATQVVTAASATGNLAISFTPECPFVATSLFVSPICAPFIDLVAMYVYDTRRNYVFQDAAIGDVVTDASLYMDLRTACSVPSLPNICFDRENPLFVVFYLKASTSLLVADATHVPAPTSNSVPLTFPIRVAVGGFSGTLG